MRRILLTGAAVAGLALSATTGAASAAPTDLLPRLSGSEPCLTYSYDEWDSTLVTNNCDHGGMVSIDVWFADPPCYYLAPGESAFFRHDGHGPAYFC